MRLFEVYNRDCDELESLRLLGYFNDDITSFITELNSIQNADSVKISKRLSFLTVETFQNIVRHGYDESESTSEDKTKLGMFTFSKLKDGIILTTVNQITNEDATEISNQLNELNKLDSEELKEQFRKTLSSNVRTKNGGAGVGFVSILRKTTGKLDFTLEKINSKISNFFFQSNLLTGETFKPDYRADRYYHFMNDNNILLYRKGLFDHTTMKVLTELLNVKLNLNTSSGLNSTLFFVIRELVQNIYNHGFKSDLGHEGIFMVRKGNENLILSTGNFILNKNVLNLTNYLDELNSLDPKGVQNMFESKLLSPVNFEDDATSGLGMIEIRKNTLSKVEYSIEQKDDNLSFLSISVNI